MNVKIYIAATLTWDSDVKNRKLSFHDMIKHGGWGAVVIDENGNQTEFAGYLTETSIEELNTAALTHALNSLQQPQYVDFYSDCTFLDTKFLDYLITEYQSPSSEFLDKDRFALNIDELASALSGHAVKFTAIAHLNDSCGEWGITPPDEHFHRAKKLADDQAIEVWISIL